MSRKSSLGNMSDTMPAVEDIEKAGFAARWLNPQDDAGKTKRKKLAVGALALLLVCIIIGVAVGASGSSGEGAQSASSGSGSNVGTGGGEPTPPPVGAPTEPPTDEPPTDAPVSAPTPTKEPTGSPTVTEDERVAAFLAAGKHCGILPMSVTTLIGSYDSELQSVAGLHTIDLAGEDDDWEKYIEFTPAMVQGGDLEHETHIEFEIPNWIPPHLVKGIQVESNFQGDNGNAQLWEIQVRNQNEKTWERVWDNRQVASWKWSQTSATLASADFSEYLKVGSGSRSLVLRVHARVNEGAGLFDYLGICLTVESGTEPPTPPPAPAYPSRENCVAATELTVVSGTVPSEQSVTRMELMELVGAENDPTKYIAFRPSDTGAEVKFGVQLKQSELPATLVGIRAFVNYRGPREQTQRWVMQVWNRSTQKWEDVVDNSGAQDWWWSSLVGNAVAKKASKVSDYVDEGFKMVFRWTTATGFDATMLDYAAFCLVPEFDELLPSPHPTTSPTPKPTRAPTRSPTVTQPTPPTTPNPTGSPTTPYPTGSPTPKPTRAPVTGAQCVGDRSPHFAKWSYEGAVCGIYVAVGSDRSDLAARHNLLQQHKDEGCRTIMLDSTLSFYLTDEEYEDEMQYINEYAQDAHSLGLTMIVYYPTLEIISLNATLAPNKTAGFEMRDAIQRGLSGQPNLFVGGNLEHWVGEDEESAWFDPEDPAYTENYFLPRVRRLAETAVDGLWGDVPLYYDTGASWSGGTEINRIQFREWSKANGLCGSEGCALPDHERLRDGVWDYSQKEFHYWLVWRHHSLAKFLHKVLDALRSVNEDAIFMVENYPADYMDGTLVALDASYFDQNMRKGMSTVWEIDSVSNANAMLYAHKEDYVNQIIMRKYARGVDKSAPTWTFAYGSGPLDSAMVLSGAFAVGTNTLESKTPTMTTSASSATRTAFYNWVLENSCTVMETPRVAQIAVLYSTVTRDHFDLVSGTCGYAMYVTTTKYPANDAEFWANSTGDSAKGCPHIGAYRGAAYTLSRLHVPFKIVVDTALEESDLDGISMLWIPSARAMPAAAAAIIDGWVASGGTVMATGDVPAEFNEFGDPHAVNPLEAVFGSFDAQQFTQEHDDGVAYLRRDLKVADAFTQEGGSAAKQKALFNAVERIVRIHVADHFILESDTPDIHIELTVPSADGQSLLIVNYAGMMRPVRRAPKTVTFLYRPPDGKVANSVEMSSPGNSNPDVVFERFGTGNWVKVTGLVDTLSMFSFSLADAPVEAAPPSTPWSSQLFKTVAEDAFDFILRSMRDDAREEPWKYGVFTNFIDTDDNDPLYSYGHHHSSEHMGLFLRAAACMGAAESWAQGFSFVDEIMISPLYKLINWAIDYRKKHAFLTFDESDSKWTSSTAPLDDFRTIQGMIEGAARFAGSHPAAAAEARETAHAALRAVYWTTISDRYRTIPEHPDYPNGLVGVSWDWSEIDDPSLKYEGVTVPSVPSGIGSLWVGAVPVNYQDVDMLHYGCDKVEPRFCGVLNDSIELMLASQVPSQPGLFFNTYFSSASRSEDDPKWGGDWEYIDEEPHKYLKVIQELWTAIHLAKASKLTTDHVPRLRKESAAYAANLSFEWFKTFYEAHGKRIPEYVTFSGQDVPDCPDDGPATNCLDRRWDNSFVGEPRIYALLVRLGNILGKDRAFLSAVITDKIVPDRITEQTDPFDYDRHGAIGKSALSEGREEDADAWNSLEPILSICQLETGF